MLVAAVLLILALVGSLTFSKWKNRFNLSEVPKKLGVDIQQEANGVTYTQSRGGHTLFKIHASKVVQLKQGGKALLHDVQIELYGADGSRVDHIAGNEFEYDQTAGVATAAGPVEITIMKPGTAPAMAPKATPAQAVSGKSQGAGLGTPIGNAAANAAAGQIEVKTSGLTFTQKTGTATTEQHVDFSLAQGTGSSTGATFDSNKGTLVLDRDVVLNARRNGEDVVVHARHADFDRTTLICNLSAATAEYRKGKATAAESKILFRQDGSAVRMDARGGFTLASANGAHVAAPQGWLEFNEKSQPQKGHMEGGVVMDSAANGRISHGTAPVAELAFTPEGDLQHAHLERGVAMHSEEDAAGEHVSRDWHSPVADVEMRQAVKGQMEVATVVGQGGVVLSGLTRKSDGSVTPSRMAADQVTALFGADEQLSQVTGVGHASFEQTAANGTVQTTSGNTLDAHFAQGAKAGSDKANSAKNGQSNPASQIESAVVDGNVVMTQQPAAKAGQAPQPVLRATGGHAVYEGAGPDGTGRLHLTVNPRVVNGGMEMTADKIDVSQLGGNNPSGNNQGDAFAYGNVKATWVNDGRDKSASGAASGPVGLGGQTPAHVVASEATFHQATGEATFRGNARLWQDANSVAAPVIVLDRTKRTLVARAAGAEPVKLVLLSAGGGPGEKPGVKKDANKDSTPSVIRVRGGDLLYTDTTRKAVLHAVPGGVVTAETGTATSNSDWVELTLAPAGKTNAGAQNIANQVERMTAHGHVVLNSQARQGTGDQLVYTGATEQYVLTGSAGAPPKMSDPQQGTVTGSALIFNSRDDSVSIEGAGTKTTTVTRAPAKSAAPGTR